MHKAMSLESYSKLTNGLSAFVFSIPLLSAIFKDVSAVPFPPVGDDSTAYRFVAAMIVGLSLLLPKYLLRLKPLRSLMLALFLFFCGTCALYLTVEHHYVVPLPDAPIKFVIRGSERTSASKSGFDPGTKQAYSTMSDAQLIHESGQHDSDLELVYTGSSLWANQMKVFGSYVLMLVVFELLIGTFARAESKRK